MKKIFFTIIAACLLVSACSKNDDQVNTRQTKLQGPIQPPTSGYGTDGTHQVGETSFANPQYAGTRVTIFFPVDLNTPRPTIFYSHPYGGEDKEYNRGLFEFVAKKGYVAVLYPTQPPALA